MTMHIDSPTTDEPIIIMRRTFDAPRALVWTVFTDPKHVVHWYGGHGFTNPVCEMDLREGGLWRHVMRTPDGVEYPQELVFVEVVRPSRLSWRNAGHGTRAAGGHPSCLMTVTLEEAGAKTLWTLVARFGTAAEREAAAKIGFTAMITEGAEKLESLLATLKSNATS